MIENTTAERSVLGTIIIYPEYGVYLDSISEDDFTTGENVKLFTAMKKIYQQGKTIDYAAIAAIDHPILSYALEVASEGFQGDFQQDLQALKDASALRKTFLNAQKIAQMAQQSDSASSVITHAIQAFNNIIPKNDEYNTFSDVVLKTMDDIEDRYRSRDSKEYYMNSLQSWNFMTAGLHRAELHIVAARPSVGKTAFALQLATDIAKNGVKTLFFSREMSEIQLVERILARVTGVSHWNIRTGKLDDDDWDKLSVLGLPIGNLPIIVDTKSATIEDIWLETIKTPNVGLVVVDYLQLVGVKKRYDSRTLEVGYISRQLKQMAMELNIPVVALAQINRDAANRMPALENLAESGKIEQDADNVYFLHRPDNQPLWQQKKLLYIDLIAAKQRQAPIGHKTIIFNPDRQAFYDLAKEEGEEQ